MLWRDIVNKRSNLPSQLPEVTKQFDMTKWSAPVIHLYLGQVTLDAVLAAADDPDPITKKNQVCDANFFGSELMLQQGKKEEAKRLLRLVTADCPKTSSAYADARAAPLETVNTSKCCSLALNSRGPNHSFV